MNSIRQRVLAWPVVLTVVAVLPAGVFAQQPDTVPAATDTPVIELPAFTEDPALPEPDYAEVAADARKIADEIESRLIDQHMTDARSRLVETDPVEGYPKTEEAYLDMKEMISFCESTGGKGGSACKFKLQISMGKGSLGNTLGQLKLGMNPGSGYFGYSGQGSAGVSGSRSPFGMYGPETFGQKSRMSSMLGPKKAAESRLARGAPDPLAGSIEELSAAKDYEFDVNAEGGERIMDEYRKIIEEYFKRLADEE